MQQQRFYYLIKIQYLGFRYHGWQKQPKVKTVESMLNKTLNFILDGRRFKCIAAGRTDAMVSVNQTYVELFLYDQPLQLEGFMTLFNDNLPQDIRVLDITKTTKEFNIIQHSKTKTYQYFFCYNQKMHPFSAPFMLNVRTNLDLDVMIEAARFFEGKHDFYSFTFRPNEATQFEGEITHCTIQENTELKANFFPKHSFVLTVKGSGFKRQQIRLMMGALIDLGQHKFDLAYFKTLINGKNRIKLSHVAPASGLILQEVNIH